MLRGNVLIMTSTAFLLVILSSGYRRGECRTQTEAPRSEFLWDTYTDRMMTEIDSTLHLSSREGAVQHNAVSEKERILFLNKDFKTRVFDRSSVVTATDFRVIEKDVKAIHLGLIEVGFDRCRDLERAQKAVLSENRSNFRVKVLTTFMVMRRNHSLIFLYTETPNHVLVMEVTEKIRGLAPEKTGCHE